MDAHCRCRGLFRLSSLQTVVLLKFFGRNPVTREYAAVAVVYRRRIRGFEMVDDAVSGTADIPAKVEIPREVRYALEDRILSPAPSGLELHARNPWTPAQRPWLTVPSVDI